VQKIEEKQTTQSIRPADHAAADFTRRPRRCCRGHDQQIPPVAHQVTETERCRTRTRSPPPPPNADELLAVGTLEQKPRGKKWGAAG
jgi:hypothetical protein